VTTESRDPQHNVSFPTRLLPPTLLQISAQHATAWQYTPVLNTS